jgi:hypothetical protein
MTKTNTARRPAVRTPAPRTRPVDPPRRRGRPTLDEPRDLQIAIRVDLVEFDRWTKGAEVAKRETRSAFIRFAVREWLDANGVPSEG